MQKEKKKKHQIHNGRWCQSIRKENVNKWIAWEKKAPRTRIATVCSFQSARWILRRQPNERIIAEINANRIKWMWQHIIMIYSMCKKGSYEHASGANLRIICTFLLFFLVIPLPFGEIVFSNRSKVKWESICLIRSLGFDDIFPSICARFRLDTISTPSVSISRVIQCRQLGFFVRFCLCEMQIENKGRNRYTHIHQNEKKKRNTKKKSESCRVQT